MNTDRKIPIGIGLSISMIEKIDNVRGQKGRSEYIRDILNRHLGKNENSSDRGILILGQNKNIFDIASVELRDCKISLAFKLAIQGARKHKLHNDFQHDFRNARFKRTNDGIDSKATEQKYFEAYRKPWIKFFKEFLEVMLKIFFSCIVPNS